MKIKNILVVVVAIALLSALAACERSASTAPKGVATATVQSTFPVPGQTDDVMGQLEVFATQTAVALQGGTVATEPPATPVPVSETQAPVTEAAPAPTETAPAPIESPATAVSVSVPAQASEIPDKWTLQKGEHPYCIARRFDVNPLEMLRLSGLAGESVFNPGTVLKIPRSGDFPGARALRSHPTTYTVQSGDTIYSVACLFGDVDPFAIAAANGLKEPYKLSAGSSIQIP